MALPARGSRESGGRADLFVGRTEELRIVGEAVHASNGECGSVLFFTGDPGIGKTSLLRRCAELMNRSVTVVTAWCSPSLPPTAGIAAQIVKQLSPRRRLTSFDCVNAFAQIAAAVRRRPLAILVDDVHLSQRHDLETLDAIVEAAFRSRVIAIATFTRRAYLRDPELARAASRWLARGAASHCLEPLPATEIGLLVRNASRRLGIEIAASRAREIVYVANGNPRYALELLADSRASGNRDVPVPYSARVEVSALRSQVPAEVAYILAVAALIGARFRDTLLQRITKASEDDVCTALQFAVDEGVLTELPGSDGLYAFRNMAIQIALELTLVASRRKVLHRRIARALRQERLCAGNELVIAEHWDAAGNAPEAVEWLSRAARFLAGRSQYHEAAALCERALTHVNTAGAEREALQEQAAIYFEQAMEYEKAIPLRESLLASFNGDRDNERLVKLLRPLIVDYFWNAERRDDAIAAIGRLKSVHSAAAGTEFYRQMLGLVKRLISDGFDDDARQCFATMPEADVPQDTRARYLLAAATIETPSRTAEQSLELAEIACDLAERTESERDAWWFWIEASGLACHLGRLNRAFMLADKSKQSAARAGHGAKAAPWATLLMAELQTFAGDFENARQLVRSLTGILDAGEQWQSNLAAISVVVGLHAGDFLLIDGFFNVDRLRKAVALREANLTGMYLRAFPEVMVARGLTDELTSLLRTCVEQELADPNLSIQLAVANFGPEQCFDSARAQIARRLERTAGQIPAAVGFLFDAMVAKRRGDARASRRLAATAADAYHTLGWSLYEALSLELAGQTEEARARYAQTGAGYDVARLTTRLSRKTARASFGAKLTAREREVARLISVGTTNPDIARRLDLSERTVHHHVEAIFSKLGIRGRWQLTPALISPE